MVNDCRLMCSCDRGVELEHDGHGNANSLSVSGQRIGDHLGKAACGGKGKSVGIWAPMVLARNRDPIIGVGCQSGGSSP